MRKLRLIGVAGLTVVAVTIPVASAEAKETKNACPKKWQPVPSQAIPPSEMDRDRNDNQIVCAKVPENNGNNPHINVKDDRTNEVVPPTTFSTVGFDLQDPLHDIWVTINNLDNSGHYFLSPAPTDYEEDVEVF